MHPMYYLDEDNAWAPDVDDIKQKINDKTKALILINPNNPTGSLYTQENLLQLIDLALEHDLVIFADEIYDKLLFDGKKHVSIASLNKEDDFVEVIAKQSSVHRGSSTLAQTRPGQVLS